MARGGTQIMGTLQRQRRHAAREQQLRELEEHRAVQAAKREPGREAAAAVLKADPSLTILPRKTTGFAAKVGKKPGPRRQHAWQRKGGA